MNDDAAFEENNLSTNAFERNSCQIKQTMRPINGPDCVCLCCVDVGGADLAIITFDSHQNIRVYIIIYTEKRACTAHTKAIVDVFVWRPLCWPNKRIRGIL